MSNKRINEGETLYAIATFKDVSGLNSAPASARYRVDCITTGNMVVDWTIINSPADVQTITIKPSQNVMQSADNKLETKRLTVEGTYGADDAKTEFIEYDLVNMLGI